jgi:hypothetical protein
LHQSVHSVCVSDKHPFVHQVRRCRQAWLHCMQLACHAKWPLCLRGGVAPQSRDWQHALRACGWPEVVARQPSNEVNELLHCSKGWCHGGATGWWCQHGAQWRTSNDVPLTHICTRVPTPHALTSTAHTLIRTRAAMPLTPPRLSLYEGLFFVVVAVVSHTD